LRGIDGAIADVKQDTSGKADDQKGRKDKENIYNYERPEGSSQLDYVRRLSQKLHKVEEKKDIRFKAIGILGSDVYDKLLLLQALRKQFSHALFFTTDLDARLLHPSQNKWARNLIVVSSYGLDVSDPELGEPLITRGRMLPPFRGVYQSSVFVAVLEALGTISSERRENLSKPKIYEVGRTKAKLLTSTRSRGPRHALAEWWWLAILVISIL
jgi:hypothetical protein